MLDQGRQGNQEFASPEVDVNELPFPAWQLIQPEWYPDGGKKFPFLTLITGRGCNNACTFCRDPQLMYGYKVRSRSAELVVAEMEYDLKLHPQIARSCLRPTPLPQTNNTSSMSVI